MFPLGPISSSNASFLGYCQYRTIDPYCRLCIHIPHYPHPSPDPNPISKGNPIPNPKPNLTLNLTLISSYLTDKHQYPQPSMLPTEWRQGYATNQQLAVRTVSRFLLAVVTIRRFVSMRPSDNNIYSCWRCMDKRPPHIRPPDKRPPKMPTPDKRPLGQQATRTKLHRRQNVIVYFDEVYSELWASKNGEKFQ